MNSLFADEHKALALSRYMLASGAALLIIGILGGYVFDSTLTLPAQVFAHILTIAGPTLVKVGYVIRLNALARCDKSFN